MEETYTPEFKAKMVMKLLKNESTQEELEQKYGIKEGMLNEWREQFISNASLIYRYVVYYTENNEEKLQDTYMLKIRELRCKSGYSQRDMGQLLGIAQNMYARYENGKSRMPIRHLVKLAAFYGVSTDYILGIKKT